MNTTRITPRRLAAAALLAAATGAAAQTPAARLLPATPVGPTDGSVIGRSAAPEYSLYDPTTAQAGKAVTRPAGTQPQRPEAKPGFNIPFAGTREKVLGQSPAAPPPTPAFPIRVPQASPPTAPAAGQSGVYAGPPAYRWYGWGTTTPGANPYAPSGQYPRGSANWYTQTGATPGAFPVPVTPAGVQVVGYEPPSYVGGPTLVASDMATVPSGPRFVPADGPSLAHTARPLPAVMIPNERPLPRPLTGGQVVSPPPTLVSTTDQPVPLASPALAVSGESPMPLVAQTPTPAADPTSVGGLTWQTSSEARTDATRFTAVRGPAAPAPVTPPAPTISIERGPTPAPSPPAAKPTQEPQPPATPWGPAKPTARGQADDRPGPTPESLVRNACYGLATVTGVRQTGPGTLVVQFTAGSMTDAKAAADAVSKIPQLKPFEVRFEARLTGR
ncbi:MAG: hypothetical protein U0871_03860 [Gemmataceae bacterium]